MSKTKIQKAVNKKGPTLTPKQTLEGSKFRILNERLYTSTSEKAHEMFKKDPKLFDIMHRGFANQATTWPIVPVDEAIKWIREKFDKDAVIADMGCGDAKVALELPNKVYSFDFKARNSRVTECDMSNTPLESGTVDIVLFVMSLMGTNLGDFVTEARRIMKPTGTLLIIEITSRIDNEAVFIEGICGRGFRFTNRKNLTNYFTWLEFKAGNSSAFPAELELKPCIYKKR